MVEEEAEVNDLTRFERFKKWARKNLLGISAVSISVAGILTTAIMAGRNALKRGAQAASKFGKALANLAKKFGPILSAIGTLVSKVLTLGVQGILFLAQNLWILVLALTYFIYNEYMSRHRK
jgi:Fe2+ transport system protein B